MYLRYKYIKGIPYWYLEEYIPKKVNQRIKARTRFVAYIGKLTSKQVESLRKKLALPKKKLLAEIKKLRRENPPEQVLNFYPSRREIYA